MVFTEIKKRKGKKYYYRVISIRNGRRVGKKREYLGANLKKEELLLKENLADKKIFANELSKNLKDIIPKIIRVLKKYEVEKAGIFGSYARGEQKKDSDIDILITHPKSPKGQGFSFVNIEYDLRDALKRKVDLLTYNSLSPYLKERILKEEIRII